MDLVKTAPILCAGITMYSPLMHWGAGTGEKKTVGIVGIGENMFKIIDISNLKMNFAIPRAIDFDFFSNIYKDDYALRPRCLFFFES